MEPSPDLLPARMVNEFAINARAPVPHPPLATARAQVNAHIEAGVIVHSRVRGCALAHLSRRQVLLLVTVPEFREPLPPVDAAGLHCG